MRHTHTQTHGYINIYILQHSRSPQLPPPSVLSIRWASRPPHRSLYLEQQRGGEHHDTFRSSRFHPEISRPIAWPEPKLQPCWDRLVRFGKLERLLFLVVFEVLVVHQFFIFVAAGWTIGPSHQGRVKVTTIKLKPNQLVLIYTCNIQCPYLGYSLYYTISYIIWHAPPANNCGKKWLGIRGSLTKHEILLVVTAALGGYMYLMQIYNFYEQKLSCFCPNIYTKSYTCYAHPK